MRISALGGQSKMTLAQTINMSVMVFWLAILIGGAVTISAPPSFAADAGPLTVRVRQTGGAALNGATVCVKYQKVNRCGRNAQKTSNGIATMRNVPYGNVMVTISKVGFTTQNRKISFNSGTPTSQFILSPVKFKPGPALTITSVVVGEIDETVPGLPTAYIFWQTNGPSFWYAFSLTPTVSSNLEWWDNDLRLRTPPPPPNQGRGTWYIESPSGQPLVPGQIYRVYLHVKQEREGDEVATREVRVRYGQAPPPPVVPAQDYVVSGINAVAEVLELADQSGFQRSATRARPPSTLCYFGRVGTGDSSRMYATFDNKGFLAIPQAECTFIFFGGTGGNVRLAQDWYIKDVKVVSIESGESPYCDKSVRISIRSNAQLPRFIVKATPTLPPSCVYVISELTFRGPQHEDGWRGAFR